WAGMFTGRALPILIAGISAALAAGWFLLRGQFARARTAAIAQVAMLLAGWLAAGYPYIVYPELTIRNAAAPAASLRFFLIALPLGMLILGPSLYLLFKVFKSTERHS
ncbi:MAG TPA: cytochrome d ubiquinol oxidase subunit II, partial [Longimicrobiales bacterium]|nr:cytochrome d ubiquinol oxidase subunit II [Longimicrobiales bacterium]